MRGSHVQVPPCVRTQRLSEIVAEAREEVKDNQSDAESEVLEFISEPWKAVSTVCCPDDWWKLGSDL